MKVTGSATVAAPRERVYEALRDPAVLVRTIPGCERLEPSGPDSYRMTVRAGVAAVRGTYAGQVALSDPQPPSSFTLRARGQGAPGTVDATVRVTLHADDDGTRVDYDADATVGGMVGGVGQRLIAGAAKKTAAEFFTAVSAALAASPVAAQAAAPGAVTADVPAPRAPEPGAEEPTVYERPTPPRAAARPVPPAIVAGVVAGVVAGAAAALAGTALGAALTRRARGHR